MDWEDIAGHAGVVKILKNMVAGGRVPHALLFTGPAGLGKIACRPYSGGGTVCVPAGSQAMR